MDKKQNPEVRTGLTDEEAAELLKRLEQAPLPEGRGWEGEGLPTGPSSLKTEGKKYN